MFAVEDEDEDEPLSLETGTSVVDFDVVEPVDDPLTFDWGRRNVEPERGDVEEVDEDVAARGGVRFVANQR